MVTEGLQVSLKFVALFSSLTLQVVAGCGVICDCSKIFHFSREDRNYFSIEEKSWGTYTYSRINHADCAGKNLTDLPVSIDRDVGVILLGDNSITHLKNSTFTRIEFSHLKILYLNNNNITTIDNGAFNGLQTVKKLVLSGNNITYLPPHVFDNMTLLHYLSLDRNNLILPDGIFKELEFLSILKLSQCNLTALPSEIYSMEWTELDISYNNLKNISLNFTVQELKISNNNINGIYFVNNTKSVSLRVLDLSKNSLNITDNFTMQTPNLEILHLASCKLNDEVVNDLLNNETNETTNGTFAKLQQLISLESIFLEYNNISSLSANIFTHYRRLQTIYLNNNHINFSENSIFLNSSTLEVLNLQWNAITKISEKTFRGTPYLRRLLLDYNYLEIIDDNAFHELHALHFISLSGNRIKNIAPDLFVNTIKLNFLSLSDNPLDIPKNSSLLNTPSLRFIEINRCNLSEIPTEIFSHMPRLFLISLVNNSLSTADPKTFESLKFVQRIDIKGNQLVCDSHLKQLLHFFIKRDIAITPAECVSPKGDWRMLEHMNFDINSSQPVIPHYDAELDDSSTSEVLKSEFVTSNEILKSELATPEKIVNKESVTSYEISKSVLSKLDLFILLVAGIVIGVVMGLAVNVFIFRKYQCFSQYQEPSEQTEVFI